MKKYGYNWEYCIFTDVGEIAKSNEVQAVNISCGYYNEHTAKEYLNYSEFINACNFAIELIYIASSNDIKRLESFRYNNNNYHSKYGANLWDDHDDYYFNDDIYEIEAINMLDNLTEQQIDVLKKVINRYY